MWRTPFVLCAALAMAASPIVAADWPQWRGPNRDNICTETGLLKEWPKDGPPLLWKTDNIGHGFSTVSAAGGRLYTLGYGEMAEYVVALDRGTGKELWSTIIQNDAKQAPGMTWLSQRAPTVDGDRLYAVTAFGVLVCLDTDQGKEIWRKDYVKDFGGKRTGWGYCDYPLVDGDKLIITPGGPEAKIVALDKKTGDVIWKSSFLGGEVADYSPIQVAEIAGVRQYVQLLSTALVGIDAKNGKHLWRFDKAPNGTINVPAPLIFGNNILCPGVYGKDNYFICIKREEGKWQVEEQRASKEFRLDNWSTGPISVANQVFGTDLTGVFRADAITGKRLEQFKPPGYNRAVATLYADGRLYLRDNAHNIFLVEVAPKELVVRGAFKLPERSKQPGWTAPVISGGKLFIRDQDVLFCYDLRVQELPKPRLKEEKPAPPRKDKPREPDAIFFPTPPDAVDQMLELAKVNKTDVVADLGCGDGRIVVAGAKKYGCKAFGCDLDPECVAKAKALAKENGVEALVTIEKKDLFEVDLAGVDVVTLYLLPELNKRLLPQLAKMKAGARVVSHQFPLPGVKPGKTVTMTSKGDGAEHTIWLYTLPLDRSVP